MSRRVLVVAAHTDDEALGCGGTIARHVADGDTVYAVFLADGVTSRPYASEKELEERNTAAANAHRVLGIKKSYMLGFPDNRMDSVPLLDIVQKLEEVVNEVQPAIVYTHHMGDLNIDHRITHQAVLTACRPVPKAVVRDIYAFEVVSATEWHSAQAPQFNPTYYVDVAKFIDVKVESLKAYALEMRSFPHSRSVEHIRAIATYRGSSVGFYAAEAFMLIRCIR
jgi:LmbE family N-acetylglucosaminyl deacetylase